MKPTRKLVTPIKGLWNSKRPVWFQKNDDSELVGWKAIREASERQEAKDDAIREEKVQRDMKKAGTYEPNEWHKRHIGYLMKELEEED